MATIITETPGALDGSAAVPLTGTRSRRRPASAGGGAARRTRRTSLAGDALVASLTEMVDELIKENRQLKRAIAQAEKSAGGSGGRSSATQVNAFSSSDAARTR